MTPKEKAKQLFEQMFNISDKLNKYPMCYDTAKACALVCVNKQLELIKLIDVDERLEYYYDELLEVKDELHQL